MKKINITIFILWITQLAFAQSLDNQLLQATYDNNERKIFDLLRNGANANAKNAENVTPLMYAVQNGNYMIADKLIKCGANVNAKPKNGIYPLIEADFNQDTAIFLLLLENGADPNIVYEFNQMSVLMIAISNKNYFFTEALLEYGANPNKIVQDASPLMQAIFIKADTSLIKLLLDYKANPNYKNPDGYTPLKLCTLYKYPEAASLLLSRGAKANTEKSKDYYKSNNELEYAIEYRQNKVLDLYLPYYQNDLDFYHTKAVIYDNKYAAKKIREKTKKLYLQPIFSHILISPELFFNHNDIFGGVCLGLAEARHNLEFKIGFKTRLKARPVAVQQRANYYLQVREKRNLITLEIVKNFPIKTSKKFVFVGSAGVRGMYSISQKEVLQQPTDFEFLASPMVGFYLKHKYLKYGFTYYYMKFPNCFPHYFGANIDFLIPFK